MTTGHRPNVRHHPVGVRPLQVLGEIRLGPGEIPITRVSSGGRRVRGARQRIGWGSAEWITISCSPLRHRARCGERPAARVPVVGSRRWFAGFGVDTPRIAAQIRFRCYPAQVWRSRTLRTWWAMPARMSPRRFIARSFEPVLTRGCNGHECVIWWPSSWSVRLAVRLARPMRATGQVIQAVANNSLTRGVTGGRYWI